MQVKEDRLGCKFLSKLFLLAQDDKVAKVAVLLGAVP